MGERGGYLDTNLGAHLYSRWRFYWSGSCGFSGYHGVMGRISGQCH